MQSKTPLETLLDWLQNLQANRLVLEEIEVQQNMNPSAIHIPTFLWSVLAVIVGLILYHFIFGKD
jgi:type II secretory pathway component PulM